MVSVPKREDDPDVKRLEKLLKASHDPFFVDVRPEPWALVSECFPNVERKVKESGGRMVIGWQVWKSPNLIEGEFHGVWEDPDGNLIDITPKEPPFERILFVEDENAVDTGQQVDNIRLNTSDNKLVDDFIEISKALFAFENKGDRANKFLLVLSDEEVKKRAGLEELRDIVSVMLMMKQNRSGFCACRSGVSFAACHGKGLSARLQKLTS